MNRTKLTRTFLTLSSLVLMSNNLPGFAFLTDSGIDGTASFGNSEAEDSEEAQASIGSDTPQLRISRQGSGIRVEWPLIASDCVLEQSPHLVPPIPWTRVAP